MRRRSVVIPPPPDPVELDELPPDPGPRWPDPPGPRVPPEYPPVIDGWILGGDPGLDELMTELSLTDTTDNPDDPDGPDGPDGPGGQGLGGSVPIGMESLSDLDRLLAEISWDRDEAERALFNVQPPAWASAPAGPELAAALDQVRVSTASPVALIELMKAATRIQAWAEATTTAAMAAFWQHREKQAATRAADGDPHYDNDAARHDPMRGAAHEIAAALRLAPRTALGHINNAVRLTQDLPQTFTALRAGRITMTKARVILDTTEHLTITHQQAVQDRVLHRAPNQTRTQLGAACRRATAAIDPDGENERHKNAKHHREITVRPLPDGMAQLTWTDSADLIQTAWIALNCLADAAKTHTKTKPATQGTPSPAETPSTAETGSADTGSADTGSTADPDPDPDPDPDRRTADQRRCDAAADLFRVLLDRGTDWLDRPFPTQQRRRPHIEVLIPITVLLGIREDPCELAGYGPIPSDMA